MRIIYVNLWAISFTSWSEEERRDTENVPKKRGLNSLKIAQDLVSEKVVPTIFFCSGKEYSAPSVFDSIKAHDITAINGAPWFDVEALEVDGFTDQYNVNIYPETHH